MDARSLVAVAVAVGVVACGGASDPAGEGGDTTGTGASGGAGTLPVCGNGVCSPGEDFEYCPFDCHCGNGTCDFSEVQASCPADCYCGNRSCDTGESFGTCPEDCTCGNGVCEGDEGGASCPDDCFCGNGACEGDESAASWSCPEDCFCGNGVCDPGEGIESCPQDGCTCGNFVCDEGEDHSTCGSDCPPTCPPLPADIECGVFWCDTTTEVCVERSSSNTSYHEMLCEPIPSGCEQNMTCACMGNSICGEGVWVFCGDANECDATVTCVFTIES